MTDLPPDGAASGAAPAPAQDPNARMFRVLAQYVADSSFENPGAPLSLRNGQAAPQIELSVDMGARRVEADAEEVSLRIRATAKRDGETVFIAELLYAGLFAFINIPDNERAPIQMIECPRILFPFARQILADMTRDGGYPPVMLEPIDFTALYRQRLAQQQAQQQQAAAPAGDAPAPN